MPADFTGNPDLKFPRGSMEQEIRDAIAPGDAEFLDATRLATALMGDSIATNLFMVGYAYQRGLIPLSVKRRSCARSSSTAPRSTSNKQSFALGPARGRRSGARRSRGVPEAGASPTTQVLSQSLDDIVDAARQVPHRLPGRGVRASAMPTLVAKAQRRGSRAGAGVDGARRSGRALRLQAPRDQGRVRSRAAVRGDGLRGARRRAVRGRLQAHLPPRPAADQQARLRRAASPKKSTYGPWMMTAFRCACEGAPLPRHGARHLRPHGGAQDGAPAPRRLRDAARRAAREARRPPTTRSPSSSRTIPEFIRGYGHVKERHLKDAKAKEAALLAQFRTPAPASPVVEKVAA